MNSLDKQLFKQIQLFGDERWILTPDSADDGDVLTWDEATETWVAEPPADTSNFIEKPSGAVAGDTLRYNGTNWVAADADTPYLSLFSAYNDGAIAIATDTDITFSDQIVIDTDIYDHTTSAAAITVLSDGIYYVDAETTITATGGGAGTTHATCWLDVNGSEVTGTRDYETLKAANDNGKLRVGTTLNLTANDDVKFRLSFTTLGLNFSTVANTTRISITTQAVLEADIPSTSGGSPIGLLLALTYAA